MIFSGKNDKPLIITATPTDFINCTFSNMGCIVGFTPTYVDTCLFSRCFMYQVNKVIATYLYDEEEVTDKSKLVFGDWFRFEDVHFCDCKIFETGYKKTTKISMNNCLHGYIIVNIGTYYDTYINITNHHTELDQELIQFNNPFSDNKYKTYKGIVIKDSWFYSAAVPKDDSIIFDNCVVNWGNSQNYSLVPILNGAYIRTSNESLVYYDKLLMENKKAFKNMPFYSETIYLSNSDSPSFQKYTEEYTARYAIGASLKEDVLYYNSKQPIIEWSDVNVCPANKTPSIAVFRNDNKDDENVYFHIFKKTNDKTYRCVIPVSKFITRTSQNYAIAFADEPLGVFGFPWKEFNGDVSYVNTI